MRASLLVAALGLVLATSDVAVAWTCGAPGCPAWCGPVEVSLGSPSNDLESEGSGRTAETVSRALLDWGRLACVDLVASVVGGTTASTVVSDGESVVRFVETGWPHDANVVGVTLRSPAIGACLVEADIELNAEDFAWTSGGASGEVDAYSVLLHEGGHLLGLGHSEDPNAAMYPVRRAGVAPLGNDDVVGVCMLYPRVGAPLDCTSGACPVGYTCVAGACVPDTTPECASDADCPGRRCDFASARCVDAPAGASIGAACDVATDCASGLCVTLDGEGRCTEVCDARNPRSCPSGAFCDGFLVDGCDSGLCLPGEGGAAALEDSCARHVDCASLHCARGRCAFPCALDEAPSCPGSLGCFPSDEAGCGACGVPGEVGAPCLGAGDCATARCLVPADRSLGECTAPCTGGRDCPDGFACDAIDGGERLCVRRARSGGCAVGDGTPAGLAVLLVLGLVLMRRRACAPRPAAS